MNVRELIAELKEQGYKVKFRERTDGGIIITEINNMKFKGASGNAEARRIVGVSISPARMTQLKHNVDKYIKGKKEKTLDDEMKAKLKKVQKAFRKNKVGGGKATISAKKVKYHIKTEGRKATESYLEKASRYAEGYAYMENVEYLANYVEDMAKGTLIDDDLQNELYALADYIRSKKQIFKEEWIEKIYRAMYDCMHAILQGDVAGARACVVRVYTII